MRQEMKITNRDYQKAAQSALKKHFGFAPALKDIVLLEGGDNGNWVTNVAFAVSGKGYSWRIGCDVERTEVYDC